MKAIIYDHPCYASNSTHAGFGVSECPEEDDDDAFAASEYLAVCEIRWRRWEVAHHQHQHHSQPTKGTRSGGHHLGHTLATTMRNYLKESDFQ